MTAGKTISIVVPAFKAAHLLPRVLPPLLGMRDRGEVTEVIVVDDCSPDATMQVAEGMGATVIKTPQNGGPGVARNLAATVATGDIMWVVDSDVIAHDDGAHKVREAFANPEVKAMFGSYDETPDGSSWFSTYKNLTHRYYHQTANPEASTFWAGCGAVDREFFLKIGGFDVETYKVPSIEDIELGYRIRANGGRIVLDPTLLGKHLKIWTIPGAIRTDVFCRALPWSRLMIGREGVTNDLNTSNSEKMKAGIALLLLLSLLALPFNLGLWWIVVLLGALALIANWDFAQFLARAGGWGFAAKGLLYHQVYYVYSSSVFVWCLIEYHLLGRRENIAVDRVIKKY